VAHLALVAPADRSASLCACWSAANAPCSRSRNQCVTAQAAGSATLDLPMRMVCGQIDEGSLDLEVVDGGTALEAGACAEWAVAWEIRE
jgi:hypothetical protein